MSLSVRLYPGTGPLIRDRHQAAMLGALISIAQPRWRRQLEVGVYRPVRGFIDCVLRAPGEPVVACEAESDLQRIEQQVRWSSAKADALATARTGEASPGAPTRVVRLLLLRSTIRTRSVVTQHSKLLATAYPARAADAYLALTGSTAWPGDALLWCSVDDGVAVVLDRPPRGIAVGR